MLWLIAGIQMLTRTTFSALQNVILLFILLDFNLVCLSLKNALFYLFSQLYWC